MSKARTALLLLSLLFAAAQADVPVPPLTARVTDLTATLSASQKDELERALQTFEEKKGSQIAVLIVPTTQPEAIEQYAIRVVEKWKLGRKGIDDGALLLIAKDDRALRVEVGYGLEGALNDATAKRIIAEIITPRFQQRDFFGGIQAGVQAMINIVNGEPLPESSTRPFTDNASVGQLLPLAFLLAFIVAPLLRGMIGRFPAGLATGAIASGIIWLFAGSLFIALVIGILAFLFSLFSGIGSGRGGYYGGGFGRGGGLGGGGFSGGGGGFGGGGASGRW